MPRNQENNGAQRPIERGIDRQWQLAICESMNQDSDGLSVSCFMVLMGAMFPGFVSPLVSFRLGNKVPSKMGKMKPGW